MVGDYLDVDLDLVGYVDGDGDGVRERRTLTSLAPPPRSQVHVV
jgi:hypothetical protein